jgi:hypothetical protein
VAGAAGAAGAALLLASVPGCAGGYRLGAGVSAGTDGRVEAVARVGGSFGIALKRGRAIEEMIEVDVGGRLPPEAAPVLGPAVGIDYVHVLEDDPAMVRLGLHSGARFGFTSPVSVDLQSGPVGAVLMVLEDERTSYRSLGTEMRLQLRTPNVEAEERPPLHGQIELGVVYQYDLISTFDDMFGSFSLPGK